jgi:curved DNA-binding protein CbpA
MARRVPNYYKVLNIKKYATEEEIRTAYKKEALRLIFLLLLFKLPC